MFDLRHLLRPRVRSSRRHRAGIVFGETLESRTLLSGNVVATLDEGNLTLRGDSQANSILVTVEAGDIVVRGREGTTINGATADFVVQAGAMTFGGDVDVRLGRGSDTFQLTGPLTISGGIRSVDVGGRGEFAITGATVEGDVHLHSGDAADTVSLANAILGGELSIDVADGRNFVSLLDSTVAGRVDVRTGNRNDVLLLEGTSVGGLHADTGGWIDDIILRNAMVDGSFHASTGRDRDFVLVEDSAVRGDTRLLLWGDSDTVVTQGRVDFGGNFVATGLLGRRDTIELSDNTRFGGEMRIIRFENKGLSDLTGINARIGRRLTEASQFRALLNGVDVGDLTLTVDTSANTDVVESNNTLVTKSNTFTIQGTTLPGATVNVTAGTGGALDLGSVTAGSDGNYSIDVDLLNGPTSVMVTATDVLNRSVTEMFNLHKAVGTVVRFDSSEGSFDVELYDADAPQTLANFLNYSDRYTDSIVHRSAVTSAGAPFVIQGGGFALDMNDDLQLIPTDPPIMSEFTGQHSNVRGTLAMALVGGDADSGTSQWFVNLKDNSQLDAQQFTVFGEVIGDGMQVVDAIAALPRVNLNNVVALTTTALNEVPLKGMLPQIQLTGTVSLVADSIQLNGTGTQFTTELVVNDVIFIEGRQFRVIEITSDTQLLLDSSLAMPITDAAFFTSAPPTRQQYVLFNSIAALL